jgi:hypothetical protein
MNLGLHLVLLLLLVRLGRQDYREPAMELFDLLERVEG